MIYEASYLRSVFCLVRKDLRRECRAPMIWPAGLLMGLLFVLVMELQADLPTVAKQQLAGGLLWLAVFLAGTFALERSFGDENDEGCWDALRMYPVSRSVIYTAKALFNFTTLAGVTAVLMPILFVLVDAPLMEQPAAMLIVVLLANAGLAAIGTLMGAITSGIPRRGSLIALLLLPLVLPVVLGAGEATRLVIANDVGEEFFQWLQLLGAFAVMFITAGVLVFDFLMEG